MATASVPKIVTAELLRGGVLITFSNGDEGFYPDALLYESLRVAQKLLAAILKDSENGSEASG